MFKTEDVRNDNPARVLTLSFAAQVAAIATGFIMALSPSAASAAGPNAKPPTPQNFRVTARTAYTVSLAWDAAPANSGDFNYHLSGAYNIGPTIILPRTATSYTFTALFPGNQYWFLSTHKMLPVRHRRRLTR